MGPGFMLSPGRGGIGGVGRPLSDANAGAKRFVPVVDAATLRIRGGEIFGGWGNIFRGALGSPRLHRGLHDRARYAGFSVCTPGVEPKMWDMLSPRRRGGVVG